MTVVVFIVTLTVAGPAFPVIIIALVPFRLLGMNRIWSRDVLMYVDRWACREGRPEDKEDADQTLHPDGETENTAQSGSDEARDVEKGDTGRSGKSSAIDLEDAATDKRSIL